MRIWSNLVFLQVAAVVSALVLTVGAILEYNHQLKLLALLTAKWVCRKSTAFDRCALRKLLLHSVGPILVVLGIAGEFIFEGRTFIVEDRQEEKARQIVGSLSDKAEEADRKAKTAISDSSTALSQAKGALSKAGAAETEANNAQSKIGEAQTQLQTLDARRQELERSLNQTRSSLAATEHEVEEQIKTSVEMKRFLADRRVQASVDMNTCRSNIDGLRLFSGTNVIIEYFPVEGSESETASKYLRHTLEFAGWSVTGVNPTAKPAFPGVTVKSYMAPDRPPATQPLKPGDQTDLDRYAQMHSSETAEALADFLANSDWGGVQVLPSQHGEICEACVKVVIGLRFNPYAFEHLTMQPLYVKTIQQIEQTSRARDEERKRQWAEHNPPLPCKKN